MSDINVRAVRAEDFAQWRALYRGYADFYRVEQTEEAAATVWSWVTDPGHEVSALVAEDAHGRLLGLAHYRPFARPLSATVGCFLDDLFVAPEHRGSGAADLLLRAARARGRARLERGPLDHRRRQPPGEVEVRPGGHADHVGHLRHGPGRPLTRYRHPGPHPLGRCHRAARSGGGPLRAVTARSGVPGGGRAESGATRGGGPAPRPR